mgnify:CR=1 FL=1|jgi:exodeoxyribonuclease VII large subunit
MKKNSNIVEYTVTQLNKSIKNVIEYSFLSIKVSGEISQVKKHSSGHIYFTLKDEDSSISGICWRSSVPRLKINIEEGINVIIKGRVTTYSPQSKYQLIVEQVKYQGEGALLQILEDRKKKLAKEGLFDLNIKKRIPKFPSSIGVITSQSGAVIKDIIHRVRDRFPSEIILFSAKVQGQSAVEEICDGIEFFNKEENSKPNILIIARGGGSLEDLMPFNDENLVRKVFESRIPIVSAVGHETDTTLCDLVADLRAPTPSAAVEMVIPNKKEILAKTLDIYYSLQKLMVNLLEINKNKLSISIGKLPDMFLKINNYFQNIDVLQLRIKSNIKKKILINKNTFFEKTNRFRPKNFVDYLNVIEGRLNLINKNLPKNINNFISEKKLKFDFLTKQLSSLSYKETLKRGFSVIKRNKKIVRSDKEIKIGDNLIIEFFSDISKVKKIK